jgi:hypothetical protein
MAAMRRSLAVLLLLVALAALVAHGRALQAGLLFDDRELVLDNPRLAVSAPGGWRRLLTAGSSLMVNSPGFDRSRRPWSR